MKVVLPEQVTEKVTVDYGDIVVDEYGTAHMIIRAGTSGMVDSVVARNLVTGYSGLFGIFNTMDALNQELNKRMAVRGWKVLKSSDYQLQVVAK